MSGLAGSCPRLQVLDLSHSQFGEDMAELLAGQLSLHTRGHLVRLVRVREGRTLPACRDNRASNEPSQRLKFCSTKILFGAKILTNGF